MPNASQHCIVSGCNSFCYSCLQLFQISHLVISSDLTSHDFFLWGFVKRLVYVPPIPRNMNELKARITKAVATIDKAMLGRVWQELDYWLDVCRVTNGTHIEDL